MAAPGETVTMQLARGGDVELRTADYRQAGAGAATPLSIIRGCDRGQYAADE